MPLFDKYLYGEPKVLKGLLLFAVNVKDFSMSICIFYWHFPLNLLTLRGETLTNNSFS